MSDAKEQFQRDEDLRKQLIAVTKADWFRKSLAFAKAELMDTPGLNADMLLGARLMETTLLALAETEAPFQDPVTSGLSHEQPELKSRKNQPKEKSQ